MKMSITRALVELKKLDQKINQQVSANTYIGVAVGKGNNLKIHQPSGMTAQQASALIQSGFDSINQMIVNRQKIKQKIVLSNANTKVVLAGKELTVAEAIEAKSFLPYKQAFLNTLMHQHNKASETVEVLNSALEDAIEKSLAVVYGNEKSKIQEDLYKQVADPQRQQKEASLFDPAKIQEKISQLQDEILAVRTELDFVLAESNAKTEIEVDL